MKLGNPSNLTNKSRERSAASRRQAALDDRANQDATEWALVYRQNGLSLHKIAERPNQDPPNAE